MGRFSVHNKPPALPGVCFICKSANNGPFVDTGVNVQFEGVVYVCETCLIEMYGLLNPSSDYTLTQVISVRNDVTRLAEKELQDIFIKLGDAVNDARTRVSVGASAILPDAPDFDSFTVEDEQDSGENDTGDDLDFDEDFDGSDSANVEGDSTPVGEGPNDVPSNSNYGLLGSDDDGDGDDSRVFTL